MQGRFLSATNEESVTFGPANPEQPQFGKATQFRKSDVRD